MASVRNTDKDFGIFRFFNGAFEFEFYEKFWNLVAFSKKLPWFEPTNVISLKTQPHAVNACVKRSSQRSFKHNFCFHHKCLTSFLLTLNAMLVFT